MPWKTPSSNITHDGQAGNINEDKTTAVKYLVVLYWLDATGGPTLVDHVHRVLAKELQMFDSISIK